MTDTDGRLTLEEAVALTTNVLEAIWSLEHRTERGDHVGFDSWGLFELKSEWTGDYSENDGIIERPNPSLGFRYSDDTHQGEFNMYYCWSCDDVPVSFADELGLCWTCLERIKYPEKTTWRRERPPWSGVSYGSVRMRGGWDVGMLSTVVEGEVVELGEVTNVVFYASPEEQEVEASSYTSGGSRRIISGSHDWEVVPDEGATNEGTDAQISEVLPPTFTARPVPRRETNRGGE